MTELLDLRRRMNAKLGRRAAAQAAHTQAVDDLEAAKVRIATCREAVALAQGVAQTVQEAAHRRVADIVSRSLEAVFEDGAYAFKIIFEQKRGRTEANLVFTRNGMELDPLASSGGGVVDVASFALRLSCLLLSRPPLRRLVVMDEPLKFLSAEYQPRARQLIEELAKELDVQFLIVTHLPAFQCGKVIEL